MAALTFEATTNRQVAVRLYGKDGRVAALDFAPEVLEALVIHLMDNNYRIAALRACREALDFGPALQKAGGR
jgi:hypothetical protein